jgi:hypothetical protein
MDDVGSLSEIRLITEEDFWINFMGSIILIIIMFGALWVWDWLGSKFTGRP